MPSLLLPATAAGNLSSPYYLPEYLKRHQIQGAEGTQVTADKMTAFIQALTINGFTFGYQILQVPEPTQVKFTNTGDSAILHYVLTGNMIIHQPDGTPLLRCGHQQYGLGYYPNGSELLLQLEQGEYHYFQLSFSRNLLRQMLRSSPLPVLNPVAASPVFTRFLPIHKRVNELIQLLLIQASRAVPDILQLNNLALRLTARFLYDYRVQEKRQQWQEKKELQLAELETYIIDHLDTDNRMQLSLQVLARKTGTSTFNFKKLFKEQYGYSPAVFILQKRMQTAMQLITGSSIPAGDIYQQVGYKDFSSFTRAFTTYHGHSPTYYRPT